MSAAILKILDPGLGATVQDLGRRGWRRFGVPPSGAMDDHAACWANRLLDNPPSAPVIEFLLQGANLEVLGDCWIAVTGADADASVPTWRAVHVEAGERIRFPHVRSGVWIYLAVEDGFEAPRLLGSASAYPRGRLGNPLAKGDELRRAAGPPFELPSAVAGRSVAWGERRNYEAPPPLRVWPGPQRALFDEAEVATFFEQRWTVSSQSDRVGYRLEGKALAPRRRQVLSEPTRVGSIQVPESGQPIVTMRDGPTVGGYPKLGMVDPADVSWLAQCRPGQKVRFEPVTEPP
jgi:biotin-dependent carboxylase-like uncharacterized protein